MKRNTLLKLTLVALVLAIAVVGVAALYGPASAASAALAQGPSGATPAATPAAAPAVAPSTATTLGDLQAAFENIYNQVNPSVVLIQISTGSTGRGFGGGGALGSGFVWDTQGNIVTNNHVVDGANTVTVTFADGTTVPAKVVGTDPDSDLAVIKVTAPASELHPVRVADSNQLKVGQLTVAIGNPYGEQNTMTTGIVSAIGRTIPVGGQSLQNAQGSYIIPDVIQTDAPINPGNSGGVLLNIDGQVIGVTQSIESQSGASAGIGFAIPSNIVKQVVPALITTGKYDHPYIGISGASLTPDIAQAMNLPATQRGALVNSVTSGGPAEKAGLKGSSTPATVNGRSVQVGGDVITAVDSQAVKTFDDVAAYLADATKVGQTVTLTILRGGQQQTVKVTLGARPASQAAQVAPNGTNPRGNNPNGNGNGNNPFGPFGNNPRGTNPNNPGNNAAPSGAVLGIQAATVTPQIAQAMNVPSNTQGVLIAQVQPGSGAEKAGLQGSNTPATVNGQTVQVGGDIITAVDGKSVASVSDLQTVLSQGKVGQVVTLTVLRGGKSTDVKVTLGSSM